MSSNLSKEGCISVLPMPKTSINCFGLNFTIIKASAFPHAIITQYVFPVVICTSFL